MIKEAKFSPSQNRIKRIEEYNKNPKLCECCNSPIDYDKKRNRYCNSSCSATITNKNKAPRTEESRKKTSAIMTGRKYPNRKPTNKFTKIFLIKCKICDKEKFVGYRHKTNTICDSNECKGYDVPNKTVYTCIFCNKECTYGKSKFSKYCSNTCHAAHRRLNILNEWLNGTYFNKKGVPPAVAKEWISEQQGHKCLICGITEWNGKSIVFQFDHIDGDPDNNTKENIRMICPNCHSQTETYGVKNKKSKDSRRNNYRRTNYKNNTTPL